MSAADSNNGWGDNSILQGSVATNSGLYAYRLKLESYRTVEEFKAFYDRVIRKWLEDNHIPSCRVWIIGDYFVYIAPADPPWSGAEGIPHLDRFVHDKPVPVEEFPVFNLHPTASGNGSSGESAESGALTATVEKSESVLAGKA